MKVVKKPWGKEEILEVNEHYVLKRLTMKAGHCCSLQYHVKKLETILVLSGELDVHLTDPDSNLKMELNMDIGTPFTLQPGTKHRMVAITDAVYLEVSTPELDDVVRISDEYGRVQSDNPNKRSG